MKREQIKAEDYLLPHMKEWYARTLLDYSLPLRFAKFIDEEKPPLPRWKRRLNVLRCRWVDFRIWLSRLIYKWDDCC